MRGGVQKWRHTNDGWFLRENPHKLADLRVPPRKFAGQWWMWYNVAKAIVFIKHPQVIVPFFWVVEINHISDGWFSWHIHFKGGKHHPPMVMALGLPYIIFILLDLLGSRLFQCRRRHGFMFYFFFGIGFQAERHNRTVNNTIPRVTLDTANPRPQDRKGFPDGDDVSPEISGFQFQLFCFFLVGGLEHFLFSHILGIIIPID